MHSHATRSKPVEKTGDINQSLYSWPSPHSRKGTGGGRTSLSPPSNSSGATHSPVAVKAPTFIVGYNRDTVFDILAVAGIEEAITSDLPEDDATRMSVKIMKSFPQADYWP